MSHITNQLSICSRLQRTLTTVLWMILYSATGCQDSAGEHVDGKSKMKPTGQDTPQAASEKAVMALLDGNYEAFDSAFYQGPAASKAFFDCFQECKVLRKALVEKYGDGAWEEFNSIEVEGRNTDFTNMHMTREVVVAAFDKGIEFEIAGDNATCIIPWNNMRQRARKASNGAWYLDHGGGETKYVAAFWNGQSVGIEAVMKDISRDDVTIEELKRIFEAAKKAYFASLDRE